jgi:hypothetical protein
LPTSYRVLGQLAAAASNAGETLYTVTTGSAGVVSSLTICNRGTTAATYRIAIRKAGAALATNQYLAYDSVIPANTTTSLTLGLALASTDVITVAQVSTANVTFQAFGSEIS